MSKDKERERARESGGGGDRTGAGESGGDGDETGAGESGGDGDETGAGESGGGGARESGGDGDRRRLRLRRDIDLDDLIIRIYEAAIDQEDPEDVWMTAARFLGADIFWFMAMDSRSGEIHWHWGSGPDEEEKKRAAHAYSIFRDEYSTPESNPWLASAAALPEGTLVTNEKLMPREELERTAIFNDVVKPERMEETEGISLIKRPAFWVSFSAYRSRESGPFDGEELRRCELLGNHLRRFAQIRRRLGEASRKRNDALAALNYLQSAVVLVDYTGRVSFANRASRSIFAQEDGLVVRQQRLVATRSDTNKTLAAMIDSATKTANGRGTGFGGELSVPRPSMLRPYTLIIAPLPAHSFSSGTASRVGSVAVFISDPEQEPDLVLATLQSLYGFTPAEARVAKLISYGRGVDFVCERLGVSKNTVRTQLARVLEKTGTRKQGELVRLLLTGPGTVCPDGRE
jgi:DNA-binding CsgD family transcriptional regulator